MAITVASLTKFWRERPLLTRIALIVWLLGAAGVIAIFVTVAVMIVLGESGGAS